MDIEKNIVETIYSEILNNYFIRISLIAVLVAMCFKTVYELFHLKEKRNRLAESRAKKDVVMVHQLVRSYTIANPAPFSLKLETYLRMANIPYESAFDGCLGPKGKCPYITLNGEDIADSQLIIELLNKKFDINLNSDYSDEDLAVGHAFRIMCENFLYWNIIMCRYIYDGNATIMEIIDWPWYFIKCVWHLYAKRIVKQSSWQHGIGRHAEKEVIGMGIKDLEAISKFLGKKSFFLGEKPCEIDAAVFGMLAQCVWALPGSVFETLVHGELSNIKKYCYRMKERFWPDWNNCLAY